MSIINLIREYPREYCESDLGIQQDRLWVYLTQFDTGDILWIHENYGAWSEKSLEFDDTMDELWKKL